MKRLQKSENTFIDEELDIFWCGSKDNKYQSIYELDHSELSKFIDLATIYGYRIVIDYIDESRLNIDVTGLGIHTEEDYWDSATLIFNMKTPSNCELYLYSKKDLNLARILDFLLKDKD